MARWLFCITWIHEKNLCPYISFRNRQECSHNYIVPFRVGIILQGAKQRSICFVSQSILIVLLVDLLSARAKRWLHDTFSNHWLDQCTNWYQGHTLGQIDQRAISRSGGNTVFPAGNGGWLPHSTAPSAIVINLEGNQHGFVIWYRRWMDLRVGEVTNGNMSRLTKAVLNFFARVGGPRKTSRQNQSLCHG